MSYTLDGDDLKTPKKLQQEAFLREALAEGRAPQMTEEDVRQTLEEGLYNFIHSSIMSTMEGLTFKHYRAVTTYAGIIPARLASGVRAFDESIDCPYYLGNVQIEGFTHGLCEYALAEIRNAIKQYCTALGSRKLYSIMLEAQPSGKDSITYTLHFRADPPVKSARTGEDWSIQSIGNDWEVVTDTVGAHIGVNIKHKGEVIGFFDINEEGDLYFKGDVDASAKLFAAKLWTEWQVLRKNK
jgi:hypothetical protein